MTETPLDRAHAAMEAAPDNAHLRLRFYERLADAELFLLLETEPEGENITPRLFPLEDGPIVLAFDTEERLAAFAGAVPYAALSGRVLTETLEGSRLGLGLNLEVAPSAIMLPHDALDWLAESLRHRPDEVEARIEELTAPAGLPESLLEALDAKLAGAAAGRARHAWLAGTRLSGGQTGHVLAFIDALKGAEPALSRAVGEVLGFSGLEDVNLDVGFFDASDPMAARLAKVGLRFELPEVESPSGPAAPGTDPSKPPRLR